MTCTVESSDPGLDIGATLISSSDVNFHAWSTLADDDHVHTTMNALDPSLPHNDICHHDTGANRHVFRDQNAFETYELTTPITMRGFGHNLSMIATGCGTVRLESCHGSQVHNIMLQNVLHVPMACTNLVSSIQLDKAGVTSTLGNGLILLMANGKTIIEGRIVKDMYHLDLKIVTPNTIPLASRLSAPSLILRVESQAATLDFCTT